MRSLALALIFLGHLASAQGTAHSFCFNTVYLGGEPWEGKLLEYHESCGREMLKKICTDGLLRVPGVSSYLKKKSARIELRLSDERRIPSKKSSPVVTYEKGALVVHARVTKLGSASNDGCILPALTDIAYSKEVQQIPTLGALLRKAYPASGAPSAAGANGAESQHP